MASIFREEIMYKSSTEYLMKAQQELAYAKAYELLPEEAIIHIQIAQLNIVEALKECETKKVMV